MTGYNFDFLISALVFLFLLLFHSMNQKKLQNINGKIFNYFIALGILDILFDMLSTIMMDSASACHTEITKITLTIFYMMQALVPYAFMCYIYSLRSYHGEELKNKFKLWFIPTLIILLFRFSNLWSGLLFYFDPSGIYHEGAWYLFMYIYVFVYVLLAALDSIIHFKEIGWKKFFVLWEFFVIACVCVGIQAYNHQTLMTGFGLCLGIAVLFLTLNNPYAYTDRLTDTFDNTFFEQWIQEKLYEKKAFHLLSVDVYQLKRVNKVFGTSVGDQLLIQVAHGLQEISNSIHIFRITGNRFILMTYSLEEYEKCRNGILKLFEKTFQVNGEEISFPAIICGIRNGQKLQESDVLLAYIEYLVSIAPESETSLLIQGDEKNLQGFRYEQEIERYLNTAIEEDLFEVYYQPVFSLETGKYITLEALSRLRHPSFGPVSPEVFIGIAEKSGQIARIGYLQFRRVCRFIKEHEEIMSQIKNIKFNLSPLELLSHGYSQMLIDVIREFELSFDYFQFEITETVATEYNENLYQAVTGFLDVGIGLCLDDFGSGYANLNTVLKLPFSSIKLDRSLLSGILDNPQIASFYENIVSILQNMGYNIIAEGVETEQEMKMLAQWGVDLIQGYYYSPPVPEKEICQVIE